MSEGTRVVTVPEELLRSFVDRDVCWFDHHGGCQAHGFLSLKPGQTCPQQDLKTILAQVEAESPEVLTFNAADYGIAWPNTPKGIIQEALREFVGDGEGVDGAVFTAFVNEVRAPLLTESNQRELHHFETERKLAEVLAILERVDRGEHGSDSLEVLDAIKEAIGDL